MEHRGGKDEFYLKTSLKIFTEIETFGLGKRG